MTDIPELINNIYTGRDGTRDCEEIVKHFSQYFRTEEETICFVDELLRRCMPAACLADINLSELGSLTATVVNHTKRYDLFNQSQVINFIHRLLLIKVQK